MGHEHKEIPPKKKKKKKKGRLARDIALIPFRIHLKVAVALSVNMTAVHCGVHINL